MSAQHEDIASDPMRSLPPRQPELEWLVRETMLSRGMKESRVLDAIRRVPRQAFVPTTLAEMAYDDRPLPIGWGQTISQPYIVAFMTDAAMPQSTDRCLEIGTGCGYQTAVLAQLCQAIYSIECVPELCRTALDNLKTTGLLGDSIHLRQGDGYGGWPEAAPFDVVIVTAAPPRVPEPLLSQLGLGGRLIVPVGPEHRNQRLERWIRLAVGMAPDSFQIETLLDVRFVPMIGQVRERAYPPR